MMRDMIKMIGTIKMLLRYTFVLLLLFIGGEMSSAWGQVGKDYSGTYYIASDYQTPGTTNRNYNPTTLTNNFYMCPTDGWIYYKPDNDWSADGTTYPNPFLTTYKCRTADYESYGGMNNAKWIITKHGDYYSFFHTGTSKYLVFSSQISGCGADRMRVHLETISGNLPNNALFSIAEDGRSKTIHPYGTTDHLTVNGGNENALTGVEGTAKKTGGPTGYTYTTGVIGIYRKADDNKYLYLEDYIKRPEISYTSGSNVTITYPTPATIFYTTDGSDPTSSSTRDSFTGTSKEVSFTNVAVVKAAAKIGDEYSNIATYVYVHTGSDKPYLLQSVANTDFYMLAGDNNNSSKPTVNTSSLPQAGMSWHFEDAGIVNGVQSYYVYNTSAEGYMRRENNNFYIQSTKTDHNDYKFAVIPYLNDSGTLAGFYLYNIGKAQYVFKGNNNNVVGNGSDGAVNLNNLTNIANQDLARWNLILETNKSFPSPVSLSNNSSTTYYTFASSNTPTQLITDPTGTSTFVKTSSGENDNQKWYFKDAGTDEWASYYYILNAVTGEAMYFAKEAASTTISDALQMSPLPETPSDNYKFALAHTVTDEEYYIVPKPLAQYTKSKYTAVWYVNTTTSLQTQSNRASNQMKWKISEVKNYVAPPVITYDAATNQATITCTTSGATIYYTTRGEDVTFDDGTNHDTSPITYSLISGDTKIRAKAKKGENTSSEATRDIIQTTVGDGDALRPYLIQTFESQNYYMIPSEEDGNGNTTLSVLNVPCNTMAWYFEDAGEENGNQYYYIRSSQGGYAYHDGTNGSVGSIVYLKGTKDDTENYKFRIDINTNGGYNLIGKGNTSNLVNYSAAVSTSQSSLGPIKIAGKKDDGASRWNILPYNNSSILPANYFDDYISTDTYTKYVQINNVSATTKYFVPSTPLTIQTLESENARNSMWVIKKVGSDTDGLLNYYTLQNDDTHEYLCYAETGRSSSEAIKMSTVDDASDPDLLQFVIVPAYDNGYNIIPKKIVDNTRAYSSSSTTKTSYNCLNMISGGDVLGLFYDNNYGSRWNFAVSVKPDPPVIDYSADDDGYTITSPSLGVNIYYTLTLDGNTPTIPTIASGTPYDAAIPMSSLSEGAVITAIAASSSDEASASEPATYTIHKVTTPVIDYNDDSNAIVISAAEDAIIYYTTDNTVTDEAFAASPATEGTTYSDSEPLTDVVGKTIRAIAVKGGFINSDMQSFGPVMFTCGMPEIKKKSQDSFTIICDYPKTGVITIYYTIASDGTPADPTTSSPNHITSGDVVTDVTFPLTIKAIATADGYNNSAVAEIIIPRGLNGAGTSEDPYQIGTNEDLKLFVTMVNDNGTDNPDYDDCASAYYEVTGDFSATSVDAITTAFTGTFDGGMHTISDLGHALFNSVNGGTVKNVILDNVGISGGTNTGAIANEAIGDSRIYNCGVLATGSTVGKDEDGYDYISSCSSSISGSAYVGGIVGLLDGSSRVINCFNYANVSGGSEVGGIVGHNNVATTSAADNLKTMVMNCMFYGEVSGTSIAPIYNGTIITNDGDANGVNNFNYFRLESSYIQNTTITKVYNCALGAETRFLQRFEFYRHLLNSNRELAAWWATGNAANKDEMMKWVMEPTQIGTATPYPILKSPDKYASVVNYTPSTTAYDKANRNKGLKLTSEGDGGVLHVTIQMGDGAVYDRPFKNTANAATISNSSVDLIITDKDFEHFNYNYGKVQLPYYNDYGTQNYKDGRVVTGWKIVDIIGGTTGSYSTGDDVTYTNEELTATPYNFADRNCTGKDLYGTSGRVFNQGAYWDVPEGVTAITIEPYWGKAVYLSDAYWDVTYKNSGTDAMATAANVTTLGGGQHYENGKKYDLATHSLDETNGQIVYTSMSDAISSSSGSALFQGVTNPQNHTVYDYAVVLVGNYHHNAAIEAGNGKPYTVTSVDLDGDNEPDYSFMLRFNSRTAFHPVRYDFLNLIGLGMAQKSTGGTGSYNLGIMQPKFWFEVTNTALFRVTQFEYSPAGRTKSPIILQGGVIEQWVTQQQDAGDRVSYFHIGGNVWFKEFHRGSHQDNTGKSTPHPPLSVTGGDYNKFYLTGLYQSQAAIYDDNAECYINGGRFGEVAGAGMEGIGTSDGKGNITWIIDHADIKEFYGGGINAAKPVHGNIHTIIKNSYVTQFCGGPKFGNMESGRTVTTTATNCTFGTYFGAGYGGNSYNRYAPRNHNNIINFPHKDSSAGNDASWNAWLARFYKQDYSATYGGVSTQFDYQFLPMSGNLDNVARIFVEYVGFSLATTHNVTSSLTGCTITGNFYGGGSLGKVDGNVTSTLTNCTVNGSVFGAGYSASLPTVEVMNIGFEKEPYYYTDLGTYRTGVFPTPTTPYHWEHATETEFNSKQVDNTKHILYTTEDLTTLGTVMGTATLTIDGSTTVGQSVYGGGDESSVNNTDNPEKALTIVTIKGKAEVNGNVFGGGNQGLVSGSTTVNVE